MVLERIRERIKTKTGSWIEAERTVIPLEYYHELEKELERVKEELRKVKEENMKLHEENNRLRAQMAIIAEEVKREPDYCPKCGWTAFNKVFRPTSEGWRVVGKLCFHCGYFKKW